MQDRQHRRRVEVVLEHAHSSRSQSAAARAGSASASRNPASCVRAASSASSVKSTGFRQCPLMWKSSSVSGPQRSSTFRSVTTFPSDFDIFSSPSSSIPLCSQIRANG